jgi:DNA-binding LacI/PurR family transcriptional regulator
MNATLAQVAERAGVSSRTASVVLNGKVREGRISAAVAERVAEAARLLDYRPHAGARAMFTKQSWHVGVLVQNHPADPLSHPLAYETILGINEGLDQFGYVVSMIRFTDVTQNPDEPRARVFRERMLDGMIVLAWVPPAMRAAVERLMPACVWADSPIYHPERCVGRDEETAAATTVERVVAVGYRKLVLVTRTLLDRGDGMGHFERRHEAMVATAARLGVPLRTEVVPYDEPRTAPLAIPPAVWQQAGAETAVIANDIYLAQALGHGAAARGLQVGRHFGLASCDDSNQTAQLWPDLSRFTFDRYALGLRAAELMQQILVAPSVAQPSQTIGGEWIPGTTAPGPARGVP